MAFKSLERLYRAISVKLSPCFLKRLAGYMYLHFFYCDLAGYEVLIKILEKEGTARLPGDFVEIGSFVGGGTRKLAKYAMRFGKKSLCYRHIRTLGRSHGMRKRN